MLRLEGAPNFRCVLGQQTSGGGHIRAGRLFRSDALYALSDADIDALSMLDIRLVCDLRSRRERAAYPNRWPTPGVNIRVEVGKSRSAEAARRDAWSDILVDPTPKRARASMYENYRNFPMSLSQPLKVAFETIAAVKEVPPLPILIHCAAGKDRTGFVVAMLLSAVGVPRELILEEYLMTESQVPIERRILDTGSFVKHMFGATLEDEVLAEIAAVDVDLLNASFNSIERDFGSVDNYLDSRCGLGAPVRELLVEAMTA